MLKCFLSAERKEKYFEALYSRDSPLFHIFLILKSIEITFQNYRTKQLSIW